MTKEEMREYQRKYYERNKEKAQAYYAKNKDKISARSREYYSKHRENQAKYARKYNAEHKEKHLAYVNKYVATHREEYNAYQRKWRLEHPDSVAKTRSKYLSVPANKKKANDRSLKYNAEHKEEVSRRGKEYYQKHKEKRAAWRSAYRARKSHNGGNYTATEWEELLMRYDYTCLRCGRDDVKMTVDHVIPLDQGGTNGIGNIQCLCFSCNSAKGKKYADYRYL